MEVDRIEVMTPQETINTEAQEAPGGAAQVGARGSRRRSKVWQYFHLSTGGGEYTATCKRCGKTLRASSTNGTTHLWRHVWSKKCKNLQQQQVPLLPAPQAPSSAEHAAQQRGDPQEKAAVSTPHGYRATSAAAVGDDYDEEHFGNLPSILSPRSERLLSDEIDLVSQTKNPTEEAPKSQCPHGPGNTSLRQEARNPLNGFFQRSRKRNRQRAQLLNESTP